MYHSGREINMIPQDTNILLSYINTSLRDKFPDLEELCAELDIDREELEERLKKAGYRYDPSKNCFK